ncbi:MAG: flagellar hook-basal body complex protein, partial [Holophaga sp.]|nr:flagellar hook-basal body complex protein [Holophaga sp.]
SNVTDMAISGAGFFSLVTQNGGRAYSRAGNFTVDRAGALVDPNGNMVLGWNRVGNVIPTTGAPVPVQIDLGATAGAAPTTTMSSNTNLDASAPIGATFTTPMQIYDSLGAAHSVLYTYTKTSATTWGLAVTTDDPAAVVAGAPASVTFSAAGVLTAPAVNPTLTISGWTNGASATAATWQIWSGSPAISSLSGYASPSTTANYYQNGFGAGTIQSLVVDQTGTITGTFTNGQTIPLAQVALAAFANPNGLAKRGDNTWGETLASGAGTVGAAAQGGRGVVLGGNLELSNVDVAEEFTKLIVAQRGYQANSRVVTTSDELLQETLNLKR